MPSRSQVKSITIGDLQLIKNDFWQVGILPQTGASIASGQIYRNGQWLDFMRPTAVENYSLASETASFLLLPWSNRIRDGKFRFNHTNYQLEIHPEYKSAIHGVVRDYAWQIVSSSENQISLTYNTADHQNVNFPFQFSAQIEFKLAGKNFAISLSLKNEDSQPMPAGFGHHPYFLRTLSNAADLVMLEVPCARHWQLQDGLPTGEVIPVTPRVDFQRMRTLRDELVDDCLTDRSAHQPIRFKYMQSNQEILLHCDRVFEHVIIYTPEGKDFFAVEPVTNANDGFNLYSQGIAGSGVFVLQPDEVKSGTIRFELI